MGVADGQAVNAAVTNGALASKFFNNTYIGIQTLNNALSGPIINNVQQALNDVITESAQNAIAVADHENRLDILEPQVAYNSGEVLSLRTLSGTLAGEDDLGTFSGSTIADNVTMKVALQALETAVELRELLANKGVANGYAPLDGSGLVPALYLPSYVDDVLEYADLASFPVTGETGKIYIALDTEFIYRWSGSMYVQLNVGGVVTVQSLAGNVTIYSQLDDPTAGANQTLASVAPSADTLKSLVRLTGALTSVDMIPAGFAGQQLILLNKTGGIVTFNNETGATAANRILTGTGAALPVEPDASITIAYDNVSQRWNVVGGSGSGTGGGGAGGSRLNLFDDPSFEQETDDEFTLSSGTQSVIASQLDTPNNNFMLQVAAGAGATLHKNFATGSNYQGTKGKFAGWIKANEDIVITVDVDSAQADTVTIEGNGEWQYFELNFVFGATDIDLFLENASADTYYIDELFVGAVDALNLKVGRAVEELYGRKTVQFEDESFVGGLGNWTSYNDGDVAVPVDGTGGTPSVNFVVQYDTISEDPFGTNFSMRLNNLAPVNIRGNGRSVDVSVKPYQKGKFCEFGIFNNQLGTDYVSGTFALFVYDVTNSTLLPNIGSNEVLAGPGKTSTQVFVPDNCNTVRLIIHIARSETTYYFDKEFKGTYFKLADLTSVPITQEQVINLAGSGNFTGGSIRVARAGSVVVISAIVPITHAGTSSASSAIGVIPNWARPLIDLENVYRVDGAGSFRVQILSNGTLTLAYRVSGGLTFNGTGGSPSISYTVDSQNTLQGLASQANLEILNATSSVFTPPASNYWYQLSGNSIVLKAGRTYDVSGRISFLNNGIAPTYSQLNSGLFLANGNNTNTAPALLSSSSNIQILSATDARADGFFGGVTFQNYATIDSTNVRIRAIVDTTIYLVPYGAMSTPANARIVARLTAREVSFSNTAIMAVPEVKMRVDGFSGLGSTNTAIGRFATVRVNTLGSFATYSSSSVLGDSVTINIKGRYRVVVSNRSDGAGYVHNGITVNASSLTTQIQSLDYASGFRASNSGNFNGAGFPVQTTWEGTLNVGDIVRPQYDTGSTLNIGAPASNYFEIEFLGWVS